MVHCRRFEFIYTRGLDTIENRYTYIKFQDRSIEMEQESNSITFFHPTFRNLTYRDASIN